MLDVFIQVSWLSLGIFVLVVGLLILAILTRQKPDVLPAQDTGGHKKEVLWIVGPCLVVVWLFVISTKLILAMNAMPKSHPPTEDLADGEILVTAHQWWWEVSYGDTDLSGANEIYIPINSKIRVRLQSADVIHSFWVPQLARKMDVIPGRDNYVWLEASQPGAYQGRCAEYCGTQHAWMNFVVYALSPDEYESWRSGETIDPPVVKQNDASAGEKLFFAHTCVNCHTIKGTTSLAKIGPDLTDVSRRKLLGGGVLKNNRENLVRWIQNAQEYKPGCKMPTFRLSDQQANQLAAYLESLE